MEVENYCRHHLKVEVKIPKKERNIYTYGKNYFCAGSR